jgi:hypothetical protein
MRSSDREQVARAERTHGQDPEAELPRQREDPRSGLALARVPGDLDRVDPAGSHHELKLVERAGIVVRGTEQPDPSRVSLSLHPLEVLGPSHQVVHLFQVDDPPVGRELALELHPPLLHRGGPDLRRDDPLGALVPHRAPEHTLGASVHRRGVDHAAPRPQGRGEDQASDALAVRSQIECPPGPQPHDRDLPAAPAEPPRPHVFMLPDRREISRGRSRRRGPS